MDSAIGGIFPMQLERAVYIFWDVIMKHEKELFYLTKKIFPIVV